MTTPTAPLPTATTPEPGAFGPTGTHPPLRRTLPRRLGLDLLYLLLGFPVALASFVVMVTMLSVSGALLIVVVGVPALVLTLHVARLFAGVERTRLRMRGERPAPVTYRRSAPGSSWFARLLTPLRDPQSWLDVVHGLVIFPVALVTWAITVTLTATAAVGCTYLLWAPFIDTGDNESILQTAGWDVSHYVVNPVLGVVALAALVPVVRVLADAQSSFTRTLLSNERIAALQARVTTLTASRASAADADVSERRRLERDIHDGPQQRLVRVGMDLASAERRLDDDPAAARRLVAEAREHSRAALDELRALSRGIAPPVLADRGLADALADVADRSSARVALEVRLPAARFAGPVENAVYFTAAEALTNVAKHAEATDVGLRVALNDAGDTIVVVVTDDGVGGADLSKGHGLSGLRDRLAALDGTLTVTSPAGGPTMLRAEVPCGS